MSLTANELKQLVRYDAETGLFYWAGKPRVGVRIGALAGEQNIAYPRIRLRRIEYKAHRLAWLYVHGEWPSGDIDHINGDPSDNRIANLRVATPGQNLANSKRRADNSSGFKGVALQSNGRNWRAHFGGQYLGSFSTKEEAHAAYRRAATAAVGEFARFA
jgi:hypothetical protein